MVSLTQWTWVCVNSGSWWWTGRPGVLGFMGSQGVRIEQLNWTEWFWQGWGDISLPFSFSFLWWLTSFLVPPGCLYVFFGKNVYSSPLPISNWIFFLMLRCISSLSKALFASIGNINLFLFFSLLVQYIITLIDLWILNYTCIPVINPTWSWCVTLFNILLNVVC